MLSSVQFGLRHPSTYSGFIGLGDDKAAKIAAMIKEVEEKPQINQALDDLKPLRLVLKIERDGMNRIAVASIQAPDNQFNIYNGMDIEHYTEIDSERTHLRYGHEKDADLFENLYTKGIKRAQTHKENLEKVGLLPE